MKQSKLEMLQLQQEVVKSLAEVRCAPYYSGQMLLKQQSCGKITLEFLA